MGSDVALSAESPLVAADDLPIHQTAETLRRPDTLHPRWTERWYFNLQHADGRLLGIVGGGFYPNGHLLEVYACLLDGPYQHNLRQRVRTSDRSRLDLGDRVAFEVTEPMRSWKVSASGPAFALQLRYEGPEEKGTHAMIEKIIWRCAGGEVKGDTTTLEDFTVLAKLAAVEE